MKIKLIIAIILTLSTSILSANTVSNLKGELSVHQGTLNYNIPLTLPTGTAGVKPSISLAYNTNGANAYVGIGWNINAGQSTISRCASNIALDGKVQGVKYNLNDNICLDGARLIVVSGSKWSSQSEYRTKIDSYSKIIYKNDEFFVYTKAGDIKEYKRYNQVWFLSKVKDRYNNSINYKFITL